MSKRFKGIKVIAAPVVLAIAAGIAGAGCSQATQDGGPLGGGGTGECTAGFSAKVDALVDASNALVDLSVSMKASVAGACARIAGMTAPTNPTDDDVTNLCDAASAKIDTELMAAGTITLEVSPAHCTVEADAQLSCEANCDVSGSCDPGTVEVRCSPGELSVTCMGTCSASGTCEGSATVAANCQGSCSGTCSGTCDGTCEGNTDTSGTMGACEGTCMGTCNGTCKGDCVLAADANIDCGVMATCKGECMGTATEPKCEGELMPPSCNVDADCEAGCKSQASLKAECTPPSVNLVASGTIDSTFEATLEAELPAIMQVAKVQGQMAIDAAGNFVGKLGALASAAAKVGALCTASVGGKIAGAVDAAGSASASVNVSFMASASVSGSASGGA